MGYNSRRNSYTSPVRHEENHIMGKKRKILLYSPSFHQYSLGESVAMIALYSCFCLRAVEPDVVFSRLDLCENPRRLQYLKYSNQLAPTSMPVTTFALVCSF